MNRHSGPSDFFTGDGAGRQTPRSRAEPYRAADDANETSLLAILRPNLRLILAMTVVGVLCAGTYVATAPAIYTAKARVYLESRTSPVTARDTPGAATPLEIPEVESQVEYIRSEKIALAAVRKLGPDASRDLALPSHPFIAQSRIWLRKAGTFIEQQFGISAPAKEPDRSPELQQASVLREGIEAYRVGAAYVIEVGYSLNEPARAAAVANAVADAYVSTQLENRTQLWKVAGAWMLQRLTELQQLASKASRDAQTYKAEHAIIDLGKRGLVGDQQLEELNTALAAARTKTVDARALRDQITVLLTADIADPGMTEAFKDSVVVELRKRYVDLLQRGADLKRRLGPEHEAAQAVEKDIAAIKQSLRSELARLAMSFEQDYRMAKAREDTTAAAFNDLIAKTLVTNNDRVRAKELDRAAETYDLIYTNLLQRYVDAVNQQSYPQASAHVITPASTPEQPSAPRSGLIVLLGALIGTGAGVSCAFGRQWCDRTLRTTKQLTDRGVACLAALPEMRRDSAFRRRLAQARAGQGPDARRMEAEAFKASAVRLMPHSDFVEALHGLKIQVLRTNRRGATLLVGVTSLDSGVGKTMLANNFALLLAPSRSTFGGRVLLVDADIRHPTLSGLLGAESQQGLIDVLAGRCGLEDTIATASGNLHVLPLGHALHDDPHVSDLFADEAVGRLVRDSRSTIDRIIVDLPPVRHLPALQGLLDSLDGLILVVEAGRTNLDDIIAAVEELEAAGTEVIGVVINKVADAPSHPRKPARMPPVGPFLHDENGGASKAQVEGVGA